MPLRLRLITPTRTVVDTGVEQVTAPGAAGEFGVLPQHVAFVGALEDGVLTYVEHGARHRVLILGGYADVADDLITVLADDAELPDEIDPARTRAELDRVRRELSEESANPARIEDLLREQRRLEIRLTVAA